MRTARVAKRFSFLREEPDAMPRSVPPRIIVAAVAALGLAVAGVSAGTAFAGDQAARAADRTAVPADDEAKGLIYNGLQRRPGGPCAAGLLEVKGTSPIM